MLKKMRYYFFSVSAGENKRITKFYGGIIRKMKGWNEEVKLEGEKDDEEEE